MRARTEKEIRAKIQEVFDSECSTLRISETRVNIVISRMYDYIDCSFKNLRALADFFETDNLDVDQWSSRGCDTCDYGSSYTKEFTIT